MTGREPPSGFGSLPQQRVGFGDRLSALCAMEATQARGDADRMGEMIERLVNAVAFTIAIAASGNSEAMATMLQGAESYLTEAAASHIKVAKFLEAP